MSGVTLLCTVYNKEKFLPKVLDAIWRQVPDRPREFIFVDDGSRDRSVEIVREFTKDWPNCHIVEHRCQRRCARRRWTKMLGDSAPHSIINQC